MRTIDLIKLFLTSPALLLIAITAVCQTKMTEGRIVYEIKNTDSLTNTAVDSSKSFQWIYRFKGNKQRTDYIKPENEETAFIYDNKTYDGIWLHTVNGIKTATVYIYKKGGSMVPVPSREPFKYTKDSKIICGYKCYKAKYVSGKEKEIYYVYYSKDITAPLPYDLKIRFRELKGFPAEFNSKINGKEEITSMESVSFENIEDSIFIIPKDYKTVFADKW